MSAIWSSPRLRRASYSVRLEDEGGFSTGPRPADFRVRVLPVAMLERLAIHRDPAAQDAGAIEVDEAVDRHLGVAVQPFKVRRELAFVLIKRRRRGI